MIYACEVVEVMPDLPGVRVRFKDLVRSGFGGYDFARVLMPRMSKNGGAAMWLPEEGDFGLVAEIDGGFLVWLGALPFLDKNQADPTPDIAFLRHQSGVAFQVRENGDMEVSHPSGLRFTVSRDGNALPALQASSRPAERDAVPPVLSVFHPSGAEVIIDANGAGTVHGFSSLAFQDGSARFCMEDLFAWVQSHTHSGVKGGSDISGPPAAPPPDTSLSPDSFLGPAGG